MPKLFIYLPTYNRPRLLLTQLERIRVEVAALAPGFLRVLVNDNGSDPAVTAEAEAFCRAQGFGYRRNPVNLDGNANISLAYCFAEPDEWLWILSDNDHLRPGSLRLLFDTLSGLPQGESEPDLLSFTWEAPWGACRVPHEDIPVFLNRHSAGLISVTVQNVRKLGPWFVNAFLYHNSSFPHLAVLLGAMKAKKGLQLHNVPLERVMEIDQRCTKTFSPDYSFSNAGRIMLLTLYPEEQHAAVACQWLVSEGREFVSAEPRQPLLAAQSRGVLAALAPWYVLPVLDFLRWARWLRRLVLRRPPDGR